MELTLPYLYPLMLLTSTCTIICIVILIIVSGQLICDYDPCSMNIMDAPKPIKSVQCLSIFSLLSFILCLISQLYIIQSIDEDLEVPDHSYCQDVFGSLYLISWAFGQLCIYLLFIINLHYTFKNTSFNISKTVFIFIISLIIMFFALNICYIVFYLLYYNFVLTEYNFGWIAAIIVSVTEFIDFIVSIILLYLFVNRLFKLFVINNNNQQTNSVQHRVSNDTMSSSLLISDQYVENGQNADILSDFNIKQRSILDTASKYTILSSIAIISTQLFLISGVNHGIAVKGSQLHYSISFRIYSGLLSLDCLINSLCICLNFEFSKRWFNALCCLCGRCCYSLCIAISRKWYNKQKTKTHCNP